MNPMHLKIAKTLGYVSGGSLTALFAVGGPKWTAIGMALVSVAGLLGIWFPPPAQTIVPDAPIQTAAGVLTGATNLSDTNTSPRLMPLKEASP